MKKNLLFLMFLLTFGIFSLTAQTYVGSSQCSTCHSTKYNNWINSGHPYKFSIIQSGVAPTYPSDVQNFESNWMTGLGDGTQTWNDIAGVIGGYGWKVRFVGQDGIVVGTGGSAYSTGLGHNQFNFADGVDHGWVDYETTNMNKKYNYSCFKCHTTGGDTVGTWLPAVTGLGTFTEGGVGCEACHGPGSDHIAAPSASNIDRVYEQVHLDNTSGGLTLKGNLITPDPNGNDVNFMCGTCHNRSYTDPINSSGGFIKHHEQWDEFMANTMGAGGMTCITCHDPHMGTKWSNTGAITVTCASCHATQAATINHIGTNECIDCHMPYAAKSGTARGSSGYKGDIRSHLFTINPDTASMFDATGTVVQDDANRVAALDPRYVCLACHNDDPGDAIPDMTLIEASNAAQNMHGTVSVNKIQKELAFVNIYPNPTTNITGVSFNLSTPEVVTLEVYSSTGQIVYSKTGDRKSGQQKFIINGAEIGTGVYFIKLSTSNASVLKKLVIMK